MRIYEILGESGAICSTFFMEGDTGSAVQEVLRSVLLPLKSQGVKKITVKQLVDNLKASPMLAGIDIDQNYIVDMAGKSKAISKIQADPENNGLMTVYLDFPQGERQIDAKQAEREKLDINKAALRSIKDKQA